MPSTMFYAKNLPNWERILRVIAGLAVAVLAVYYWPGMIGWIVAISALGIVATGLVGFCPMCAMAGRRLAKAAAKK
ncbi:4-amino-4-deoxy-L-arabinose transferase-like glycosyltransferase [Silvimonas terrae]|uniref:4-amino-4-deoxy-L-arabinose transferase-like glycosyltransferase n=1 Tax=Silvimonas terrae TaxID=300266 RepID=A0A840RBW3_9NEIS|nr:DUF2892 domain-containing protein [Silvimonas terrae]MBB5190427.1 4-amino-4-deoxy-L-arabinose transferase-like glycosyltransferase [Silvimonas terrae]